MKRVSLAKRLVLVVLVCIPILLCPTLFSACKPSGDAGDDVSPDFEVRASFPNGAPPLGHESEFVCVASSHSFDLSSVKVWVVLPEGLQLVSGELDWTGNLAKGEPRETVRAMVKSVETGNYEIGIHATLPAEQIPDYTFGPDFPVIYVSIGEDKAEWGENPPWGVTKSPGPPSNDTPPPIDLNGNPVNMTNGSQD